VVLQFGDIRVAEMFVEALSEATEGTLVLVVSDYDGNKSFPS
jgi:hypothetical protein